jgi:hypothetical protein
MAHLRFRAWFPMFFAALALSALPSPAAACPFCAAQAKPTLIEDYKQASMVLFGKFINPKFGGKDEFSGGSSDFVIEQKLRDHKVLGKKKTIHLDRYINSKSKYLIFCDVYKGKIDPFRGVEVSNADIVKYLKGAEKLKGKPAPVRLRYCFSYLDNPEYEIALDAYREYAKADYKDYQKMAKKLPADKIAGWLKDPKTPAYRYGLYASLLGHCGKAKHAKLLRKLLDNPEKRLSGGGLDGMLVAYTMLDKAKGWNYLQGILKNPKEDFQRRYAALRTIRFIWDYRPDVLTKKQRVKGICLLLKQTDVADFAIEDLRKWKVWEAADDVLALTKKKSHKIPVIERAILRFALSCPKNNTHAVQYVKKERKRDKEYVDDVEELLKLESEAPGK